jgi:hypothetical protein
MILWHASPYRLFSIRSGSYWTPVKDAALDFGTAWSNRGCWLYSIEVENKDDWSYTGIIDRDLGGTDRMYTNKNRVVLDTTDWIDWEQHYGEPPRWVQR